MKIVTIEGPPGSGKSFLSDRILYGRVDTRDYVAIEVVADNFEADRLVEKHKKLKFNGTLILECQQPLDERFKYPIYQRIKVERSGEEA